MPVKLVQPPLAPQIRTRGIAREVEKTLGFYGNVSAERRRTVTSGWENEKPTFVVVTGNQGNSKIFMQIRLAGSDYGKRKWIWLSFGTKVRYAQMTPDFVSKTQVGSYFPRAGRGGLDHVDTNRPHPGIKARQWDKMSAKRDKEILDKEIPFSISKGARGASGSLLQEIGDGISLSGLTRLVNG